MGFGSALSYGAVGASDSLEKILARRMKERQQVLDERRQAQMEQQQQIENQFRQKEFDQRQSLLRDQQASVEDARNELGAQRVAGNLSIGDYLQPEQSGALRAGKLGTTIQQEQTLPSRQFSPGADGGLQVTASPAKSTGKERYLGTAPQRDQQTRDARAAAQQAIENGQRTAAQQETERYHRELAGRPTVGSRQQAKVGMNSAGERVFANFNPITGKYHDADTNELIEGFKPLPTTAIQNLTAGYGRAEPVIESIGELSERINVNQGVAAKAIGATEKAKALANLNDDVAEYQSLVKGFTPLIARAVGHVGVLTEQDVQSVRALFPDPTDSKSLRDRKMKRLRTIMSALQKSGAPEQPINDAQLPGTAAQGRIYYDANGNQIKR